jgi:glycosyltransferase involved in cell wall biosynthesis
MNTTPPLEIDPHALASRQASLPANRRRLRVLQVIDSLPQGGAEQLLVTLTSYIDGTRYDLRVCSLHDVDEESPVVRALRARHIPIYTPHAARWHDPRHVPQVAALIRRHQIDVVHTHLPYATTTGILAGVITRRPVIATMHSIRDARRTLGGLKQRIQVETLRRGARVIIACAPEVGADALERLHLPPQKLVVVANGIDTHALQSIDPRQAQACRRDLLGTHEGPLVVTVGNLVPAKGHEQLVEATPYLLKHFPDARVAIVGRPGHNETIVRGRIASLGLEQRVLLAGQRSDIPAVLSAADLFVLPSLWEGLPLALLEAMAAGTPVVASAVGGIAGVVEDGETGRLVPPADAVALAQAMVEMLSRPEMVRRLARQAQEHVQATYSAENWACRLQSIYDSVVPRRRRRVNRYAQPYGVTSDHHA